MQAVIENIVPNEKDKKYPVFSIILGCAPVILFLLSSCNLTLQYDRAAVARDELWRIISCHWLHWSLDHLIWSTIVFIVVGSICECFCRKGYLFTLAAASVVIPLSSWFLMPEMYYYRGMSGLASATFVFAAVWMVLAAHAKGNRRDVLTYGTLCLLFVCKLIYEAATGSTIFVETDGIFTPVPLVHLVGGGVGAITAFYFWKEKSKA